jgi:DNA-binding LacI/PurR family transcriptional regulator
MLTQRRTISIGVVTPQALSTAFANSFFGQLSEGVALVAEEGGYRLTFISPERGSLASALDRTTVDGLVVVGLTADYAEIDRIRTAGIPIVLVDSTALPAAPRSGSPMSVACTRQPHTCSTWGTATSCCS